MVVIGINYPPEMAGIAPQTAALCRHLAARGEDVFILTAKPHYPAWRVFAAYRHPGCLRQTLKGVPVVRVPSYIPARPGSLIQRLLYDGSFALAAGLTALRIPRADVYVYIGAQPAVAAATAFVAFVKRRPWVAKIADLAVNAGAAVEVIRHPVLIRLLRTVEYSIYRGADSVLVLTQGFAEELLQHGLNEQKLQVVRDSEDLAGLAPTTNREETRQRHGLQPDQPLVTHIGSIGLKQGLQVAVKAAAADQTGACWLLVGDGPERSAIKRSAPRGCMRFLPFMPRAQLADLLAASDLALLTQRLSVIESVIPSKLITYMAAGLPVVASVHADSEAARLICRADCGLVVEPEAPDALRRAIADLLADPARRQQLSVAGRSFAAREFDRSTILARQTAILKALADTVERQVNKP